jgi:hypothetical protein
VVDIRIGVIAIQRPGSTDAIGYPVTGTVAIIVCIIVVESRSGVIAVLINAPPITIAVIAVRPFSAGCAQAYGDYRQERERYLYYLAGIIHVSLLLCWQVHVSCPFSIALVDTIGSTYLVDDSIYCPNTRTDAADPLSTIER